jgi:hypothetical protein
MHQLAFLLAPMIVSLAGHAGEPTTLCNARWKCME